MFVVVVICSFGGSLAIHIELETKSVGCLLSWGYGCLLAQFVAGGVVAVVVLRC